MNNVCPSELFFVDLIKRGESLLVFRVMIRGKHCVLKVHRYLKLFEGGDLDYDGFEDESRAYERLKKKGLCERGIVPNFYGTITPLQPALCRPFLDCFLCNKKAPNAIILEYVPGLETLAWSNYSEAARLQLLDGLQAMHDAGVYHGDTASRNMMLRPDGLGRAMWLDFDKSDTLTEIGPPTQHDVECFRDEMQDAREILQSLADDFEDGPRSRSTNHVNLEPINYSEDSAYSIQFQKRRPSVESWDSNAQTSVEYYESDDTLNSTKSNRLKQDLVESSVASDMQSAAA